MKWLLENWYIVAAGLCACGGGIMAAVPEKMGIGVFSPALNKKGNSVAGLYMLEKLSEELGLSIF